MVGGRRRGFTLPELLAVVAIVLLIAAVVLPTVLPAIETRRTVEAARLLQGMLVGARARAIRDGRPAGIRLLPDPAVPGAFARALPIDSAPEYNEGLVTVRPRAAYAAAITEGRPFLVLEQAPRDARGLPASPTSWSWNVRLGDRIQLAGAGPWYTVAGPMAVAPAAGGNAEMFANFGAPGTASPLAPDGVPIEWLLLVNGRDDNANGWVDEGWDGIDNDMPGRPGSGIVDDPGESEAEAWAGAAANGLVAVPYAIRRRPFPAAAARELALPAGAVIDAARSRLPVGPAGTVEILVRPDGTAAPVLPYGVPASLGMSAASFHFAIVDRADVAPPGTSPPAPSGSWGVLSLQATTGRIDFAQDPDPAAP